MQTDVTQCGIMQPKSLGLEGACLLGLAANAKATAYSVTPEFCTSYTAGAPSWNVGRNPWGVRALFVGGMKEGLAGGIRINTSLEIHCPCPSLCSKETPNAIRCKEQTWNI